MYTEEQMDIAILKNSTEGILKTLSEIKVEISSNFKWNLCLVLGIYGLGFATLVAKFIGAV